MRRALSTVDWRKYLDVNTNTRVNSFLESRGDDVLWQISQNIQRANKRGKETLVMVVHENAPNAILIPKKDYQAVLDLSLAWFESREQYERCKDILEFKNYMKNPTAAVKKKLTKNLI